MTIGEFWTHVTTLCIVYDGRVTSGPRSRDWNRLVGGADRSQHLVGLGADVVLAAGGEIGAFTFQAERLGIRVIDEMAEKKHLHLQPK